MKILPSVKLTWLNDLRPIYMIYIYIHAHALYDSDLAIDRSPFDKAPDALIAACGKATCIDSVRSTAAAGGKQTGEW